MQDLEKNIVFNDNNDFILHLTGPGTKILYLTMMNVNLVKFMGFWEWNGTRKVKF